MRQREREKEKGIERQFLDSKNNLEFATEKMVCAI